MKWYTRVFHCEECFIYILLFQALCIDYRKCILTYIPNFVSGYSSRKLMSIYYVFKKINFQKEISSKENYFKEISFEQMSLNCFGTGIKFLFLEFRIKLPFEICFLENEFQINIF